MSHNTIAAATAAAAAATVVVEKEKKKQNKWKAFMKLRRNDKNGMKNEKNREKKDIKIQSQHNFDKILTFYGMLHANNRHYHR